MPLVLGLEHGCGIMVEMGPGLENFLREILVPCGLGDLTDGHWHLDQAEFVHGLS